MGLEVNKKSENIDNKPKLSKFGKKTLAIVILIIIILIVISSVLIVNNSKKQNLENELNNQINSSLNVMEQSLIISDVNEDILNEFYSYKEDILNEENITSKYNKTMDLLNFCLSNVSNNQSAIDELNSTRNRLEFAYNNLTLK